MFLVVYWYHDIFAGIILTFSSQGVAVYVIGIFVSTAPSSATDLNNSRIFVQINGTDEGNFIKSAIVGGNAIYEYNTTFFAKEGLPFGQHNITILNGDSEATSVSLCLLDRIIYTYVIL